MSAKITGMIWDLDLTVPQRMVLLAMADHADHNGEHMHAPTSFIAWKTGYSQRNIHRIIQDLVTKGILVVTDTALGEANEYKFEFSRGAMKRPYRGRKPQTGRATPDRMSPPTPDKMSQGGDKTSVPPDRMSPPTPDKMSQGGDKLAIDKESSLSRKNHESPSPPVPTEAPNGGDGGGDRNGQPKRTELYHWLRANGVDSPEAAERNQHHDLAATQAMFAQVVGDSTGTERTKRIGRFMKALSADGPIVRQRTLPTATSPPAYTRPPDALDPTDVARRMVAAGPPWKQKEQTS